ncbi:signal peptidase I [Halobellus sp. Atlit-31R]|nr:signal peptidase I [Halobellus sp. Atlit-31R]
MGAADGWSLRTGAHVLGVLLLIGAVAPFVAYGAPQVVGADYGFVVLSGSMEPAMSPGDAVIVREASPDEITERDVITFRTNSETPTTHRVVDVVEREDSVAYVTKGDANEDPDSGTVPHERVLGEVLVVVPLIGYVVQFVNTPLGFAVAVVVPLGLFVASELWALLRSVDDDVGAAEDPSGASNAETAEDGVDDGNGDAGSVDSDSADAAAGGTSAITLTRSSLQLLAIVFALFLPYSAYTAYRLTEAWAITGAIATGIGLLFVVGLYASSGGGTAPDGEIGPPDGSDGGGADGTHAAENESGVGDGASGATPLPEVASEPPTVASNGSSPVAESSQAATDPPTATAGSSVDTSGSGTASGPALEDPTREPDREAESVGRAAERDDAVSAIAAFSSGGQVESDEGDEDG